MKAFITGSQAYGTATEHSDIDLCIMVDREVELKLAELSGGYPILFGKLNLICCHTEDEMAAWKAARDEVIARGPLDKTQAIAIHDKHREPLGLTWRDSSGHGWSPEERAEIQAAKAEARHYRGYRASSRR